jgi:hypothetical protein
MNARAILQNVLDAVWSADWPAWMAVIVGFLALFVAWKQIKLANRQNELATKQNDLASKQNDLAAEQLRLAHRQDEILMRRAELWIRLEPEPNAPNDGYSRFRVSVENTGKRALKEIYVHLSTLQKLVDDFSFKTSKQTTPSNEFQTNASGDTLLIVRTIYESPFYPQRHTHIGTLRFIRKDKQLPLEIMWQISSEDGVFPETGSSIKTYRSDSGLLGVSTIAPLS